MLEVFHFITPLQFESFQSQQAMMQVLDTLDTKVSYNLIPLLNLTTLDNNYEANEISTTDTFNQLNYFVSLDFEAIAFQGKRIARKFLKKLQTQILLNNQPYSEKLVIDVISQIGADLLTFQEDRNSGMAQKALVKNQRQANEFNVKQNPTVLLFDNGTNDYGLLIENYSTDNLEFIINQYMNESSHHASPLRVLRG